MQVKKLVCFFSVLLLFAGLMCSVDALPDTTVSFRGEGVTIDLTFPEEAHPGESIWHNATLTANSNVTYDLTLIVRAPINSTWQDATSWTLSNRVLSENASRTEEMNFQLPSNTNGTLQCFIYIDTNQSTHYLSATFYTTQVREMTYTELLENYNILNNTYNQLLADYDYLNNTYAALNSSYNELLADYNSLNETYYQNLADCDTLNNTYNNLQTSYDVLNSSYNDLTANYDILNKNYNDLQNKYTSYKYTSYDSLLENYNGLQSDYDLLNSTHYSLDVNFTSLKTAWDALNQTYTELEAALNDLQQSAANSESALEADRIVLFIFVVAVACLIAFILYIKRKKTEPYVVIRKETVSMKSDEKS